MRLRLTIQRNGLPASNILWSVPDTNSAAAYTVTRLLEDVNHIVPLEGEHWGLEHYVLEVGGFECLHFMPVSQCLKEDDHVSIRPLLRAEIRARTLTGRHQIDHGGQHLIDGLPFGRPYLRKPSRPPVTIPAPNRKRLEEITAAEESRLLREIRQQELERVGHVPASNSALVTTPSVSRSGVEKTVHFKQPEVEMVMGEGIGDEDEDEDEDDDDFVPGDGSDQVDGAGSSDSESDSSGVDTSSASATSDTDSSSDDSSSDSDPDSDSASDSDAAPEVRSSKAPVPERVPQPPNHLQISPPGEGKKSTQSRNARRTKTNRLKHLKEAGKLHKDADLKDLEEYEGQLRLQDSGHQEQRQSFAQSSGKRKRLEEDESTPTPADKEAELERRKQEMLAHLGREDVTMEVDEPASSKVEEPASASLLQKETEESVTTPEKGPERKRLRPDVSAIGRMLARQTKNLVKKPTKVKEPTPEPEGSTDPEFWRSRINLSAFECWEEEYELTAPPFPFQQHWDPVGKVMRDAAKKKKGKKGGKKAPPVEQPEQEEEEEEKIYLNYDDTPGDDNPDVEIHAAIEDQLQQDIATASQEQEDLPPLPDDVTTLPDLTSANIKAGAVIVCKFFGINPVTVTPEISNFKTAVVEQEGDSGAGAGTIRLRIAQRDLPKKEKKFNSKGERVYDAKDGFFVDEDEEEGLWTGMFGELLEGKLLKAA